jgi:hypothetical protein
MKLPLLSDRDLSRQITLKESDLERQIADYLALDSWYVRHFELNYSERKQRSVGEKGMPDLLCLRYHALPGWANLLWIECKRPGGPVSRWQREWKERERRRGATVLLMGIDFEPSIDGFVEWYEKSGLQARYLRLGGRPKTA